MLRRVVSQRHRKAACEKRLQEQLSLPGVLGTTKEDTWYEGVVFWKIEGGVGSTYLEFWWLEEATVRQDSYLRGFQMAPG